MIEIFKTQNEYDIYTSYNSYLQSDRLYYIKENGKTHFYTNNIDGEAKIYNNGAMPQGTKSITTNGTNIDVSSYEAVDVAVPLPEGNITLTENGENINVYSYATATVNVPDLYKNDLIDMIENDVTSFTIPNIVTKIGNYAFNSRQNLTSVTIPNSVISIGTASFRGCIGLTSVTIPNSVTSIGVDAFRECSNLFKNTTMEIPNSVTTISNAAFFACTFRYLIIGSGITSIGANAFGNNYNISSITIRATTPPTIQSTSLPSVSIYVPAESVDTYKAAPVWSDIASRIYPIT